MGYGMNDLFQFFSGAAMMGAWVSGIYFVKFWSKTRDRLFLLFGAAFWIMAAERLVLVLIHAPNGEDHSLVYLIRLAAFLLIIFAIIDKNNRTKKELD